MDGSYCQFICIIPRWPQESTFPSKKQTFLIALMHKGDLLDRDTVGQPCLRRHGVDSLFGSDQFLVASYFYQDVVWSLWAAGQPTCWASQPNVFNASLTHARNIFVVLLWSCINCDFLKKIFWSSCYNLCSLCCKKPVNITYNLYCLLEQKGKWKVLFMGFFERWIVFLKYFICYELKKSLWERVRDSKTLFLLKQSITLKHIPF